MLLLVITFTFKLLVKASWTDSCTKSCKKTIGMELIDKSVTEVTKNVFFPQFSTLLINGAAPFINGAQH